MSQLTQLAHMLTEANIPFKWNKIFGFTPEQNQILIPSIPNFDVICHDGSYGGNMGYLEIMGLLTDEEAEGDSVVGWLTAEDVFSRIAKYLAEHGEE